MHDQFAKILRKNNQYIIWRIWKANKNFDGTVPSLWENVKLVGCLSIIYFLKYLWK